MTPCPSNTPPAAIPSMAPPDTLPLRPGDVVDGKFVVDAMLGSGGMSFVVEAHHITLGHRIALKVLRSGLGAAAGRLRREARTIAALTSEHTVRLFDAGSLPDGAPYLVMERLRGCDLRSYVTRRGRLAVGEAVSYVLQACDALAEAHARGIVHRDIKPSNLFLVARRDRSRFVKVLDFGIAKELRPQTPTTSAKTGSAIVGSPGYAAPEQVRGLALDGRADIWGLGIVLYELVSGRRAFRAKSTVDAMIDVITIDPPPLHPAEAPPGLSAVIARCLEKDPARRFADVGELARALQPWAQPEAHCYIGRIAAQLVPPSIPNRVGGVKPVESATTMTATASDVPHRAARYDDSMPIELPVHRIGGWRSACAAVVGAAVLGAGLAVLSSPNADLEREGPRTPEVVAARAFDVAFTTKARARR